MLLELVKIKIEFIRDGFGSTIHGCCEDCAVEEFWNRAAALNLDSLTGEELIRINSKLDICYTMSLLQECSEETSLHRDTEAVKKDLERHISQLEKHILENHDGDYKGTSAWEYILREKPKESREYSNMVSEGRLFMKNSFWDFL